ncbi:hypothetical protein [Photorhabdus viridis]|uniref:hypothetical protein n=1 Tax=Photorhabdus viridis TaxID=3163327 RepID=UPI003307B2EA
MTNISNISILNSSIENLNLNISKRAPYNPSGIEYTNTSKVILSEHSLHQSFLDQIKSNTVSSVNNTNRIDIEKLYDIYFFTRDSTEPDFLKDVPEKADKARLALSEQAADYIRSALEGKKGTSPFDSLSRQALSSIAYDETGHYTSAERIAAYKQLSVNDTKFNNDVFDKKSIASDKEIKIIDAQSKLTIISGMSESEKKSKGITLDEENKYKFEVIKYQEESIIKIKETNYNNLYNYMETDIIIAIDDGNDNYFWKTGSSKELYKENKIPKGNIVYLEN